ncbi:hypothetical protein GQ44DRAFT_832404 [Phaeosphaeriaceae sp. PMI808]|nr:hypothetical protein GQ44DRAFT_832404 [Phaeosphaeriaceae sp. PMI808]
MKKDDQSHQTIQLLNKAQRYLDHQAFPGSLHESEEDVVIRETDSNSSEVVTPHHVHPLINGSIASCGESSLTGTTLVGLQLQIDEADLSDVAQKEQENLDCMSIASNDEDISSQAPRRRTELELLALKLFRVFLAKLEDLRSLHEKLLEELGTKRFVENYRRSLKMYVLELKEEAQTALEKDTVKVLENRENRRSIALQIVAYMVPEDDDIKTQLDSLALQQLKYKR